MAIDSPSRPSFEITHAARPADQLIAGFSSFGLAGLTAVDFLVDQLGLEETGYISTEQLPAITPFENGTPRHHTRLFSAPTVDFTVLVNELFVPLWATDPFAEAILEWTEADGVEEVTVLSGVPIPHGPEEHRVFYVATQDYQDTLLAETDTPAMGTGFLDGVNASLIGRGMDSALRVGVFLTPVHPTVPDVEAALRLIETLADLYTLDIDTTALEQFADNVEQYYRDLESRLESIPPAETPEDRMYM